MEDNNLKTRRSYIIIGLIVLASMVLQIGMAWNHFTTCDDLGVALTMHRGMNFENGSYLSNVAHGFWSFWTFRWTYAPLQFIISSFILAVPWDSNWTIFGGRFPSLICGILSVFSGIYLARKVFKKEKQEVALPLIYFYVCISFNWEIILYSAQMESYTIGVLASMLCMILLIHSYHRINVICVVLCTTLFCYAQYQMFVFVFCFYCALLFANLKNRSEIKKIVLSGIVAVVLNLPNIFSFIHRNNLTKGANWNVGRNAQYLFYMPDTGRVHYIVKYWIGNFYEYIRYIVLPGRAEHIGFLVCVVIFCLLVAYGHIRLHFEQDERKVLAYYLDVLYFIWFVLICMRSIPFSPSRHFLVFVPTTLLCASEGVYSLLNIRLEAIRKLFRTVFFCHILLIALSFFVQIPKEFALKDNRLRTSYWEELLTTEAPDVVITVDYSNDLYLCEYEKIGYEGAVDFLIRDGLIFTQDVIEKDEYKIILFSAWRSPAKQENRMREKLTELVDGEDFEWTLLESRENIWGDNQEYASDCFFTEQYGEHILIYSANKIKGDS